MVYPLANISATKQARLGDVVVVDFEERDQKLLFFLDESAASRATAAVESVALMRPAGTTGRLAA